MFVACLFVLSAGDGADVGGTRWGEQHCSGKAYRWVAVEIMDPASALGERSLGQGWCWRVEMFSGFLRAIRSHLGPWCQGSPDDAFVPVGLEGLAPSSGAWHSLDKGSLGEKGAQTASCLEKSTDLLSPGVGGCWYLVPTASILWPSVGPGGIHS